MGGWGGWDLRRPIGGSPHSERDRGLLTPNARWGAIGMNISGGTKCGDNAIEENFIGEVNRRIGKYRGGNDGVVPKKKKAIRHHMGCRWG